MATWGSPASLRGVDGGSTSNDGLRCLKNENIFFFTLYYRGSDFPEHWCDNSRVIAMTDIVYLVSTLCYYKSFSNGENYVIHQLSKHTQRVVLKQPRECTYNYSIKLSYGVVGLYWWSFANAKNAEEERKRRSKDESSTPPAPIRRSGRSALPRSSQENTSVLLPLPPLPWRITLSTSNLLTNYAPNCNVVALH